MIRCRTWICGAALLCAAGLTALPAAPGARASSDPLCTGSYGGAEARVGPRIRFGIDPGIAGSIGNAQQPAVPDDPARDAAALHALRQPGRRLVVRLNRLFWSGGGAAIARFRRDALRYGRGGFEVELQVRYHPGPGEVGNVGAWEAYVRHVVDVFGPLRGVVAMTITNEVNVTFSPNTSDGYYPRAEDALIGGIEAARAEALRHGWRRLAFGFTYAYRFNPAQDAAFFSYLGAHGGARFEHALGFVGLDFYPGTIYPPAIAPGDTYGRELAQAAGVVRDCLAPKARIGRRVPIWITENGVPTGVGISDAGQASALSQLVRAAHDYSRTFNITDYRWFNLRDSTDTRPMPLFATDGLLRANYTRKPAFAAYKALIAAFGAGCRRAPRSSFTAAARPARAVRNLAGGAGR